MKDERFEWKGQDVFEPSLASSSTSRLSQAIYRYHIFSYAWGCMKPNAILMPLFGVCSFVVHPFHTIRHPNHHCLHLKGMQSTGVPRGSHESRSLFCRLA